MANHTISGARSSGHSVRFGRLQSSVRPRSGPNRRVIIALVLALVLSGAISHPTTGATGEGGAWIRTGAMVSGRWGQTSTVLDDGSVLVVGGMASSAPGVPVQQLDTAERYVPETGSWREAGRMAYGRSFHTATRLPDGTVLVVGGSALATDDSGRWRVGSSAERYDPRTDTWRPAAEMHQARQGHSATLLADGTVLVAGCLGFCLAGNTAEVYDPGADSWSTPITMIGFHGMHTATLLRNGRVLIAGSSGIDGPSLRDAELYDPTVTWRPTGRMRDGRVGHTATLLADGRILASGGAARAGVLLDSAELYDEAIGQWQTTTPMNVPRGAHTATLLPDGTVLVTGGVYGEAPGLAERYDPLAGIWSPAAHMSVDRNQHTATPLTDGSVLIAGGENRGRTLASAERYDLSTPAPPPEARVSAGAWHSAGNLRVGRSEHSATLLPDGTVLLVGGGYGGDAAQYRAAQTAEIYDPASGAAHLTGQPMRRRWRHTASPLPDGRVLVVGGDLGSRPFAEIYDPIAGAWTASDGIGTDRVGHTATVLPDGDILVVGGADPSTLAPRDRILLATAERFDAARGTWRPVAPMLEGRAGHSATLLIDGTVLVVGGTGARLSAPGSAEGSSAERYDPRTDTWRPAASTAPPWTRRAEHTATLLTDGTVLTLGGIAGMRTPYEDLPDVFSSGFAPTERYDPRIDSWRTVAEMGTPREGQTATLLRDGRVLVLGHGGLGFLVSAELYDPAADTWTVLEGMPTAKNGHTATSLPDGSILVAGGRRRDGGLAEASVDRYVPR